MIESTKINEWYKDKTINDKNISTCYTSLKKDPKELAFNLSLSISESILANNPLLIEFCKSGWFTGKEKLIKNIFFKNTKCDKITYYIILQCAKNLQKILKCYDDKLIVNTKYIPYDHIYDHNLDGININKRSLIIPNICDMIDHGIQKAYEIANDQSLKDGHLTLDEIKEYRQIIEQNYIDFKNG